MPAILRRRTRIDTFEAPYFEIRGFVQDPQPNASDLNVSIGTGADFLLVDPTGLRTGFDATTQSDLREIPQSVHSIDALVNDDTGDPPSGQSHTVNVFQPTTGTYTIIVAGLQLGQYQFGVRAYSQDGSAQPALSIPAIASVGSTSTFQIQFSSTPGETSTLTGVATFQSTLANIANSLRLGLIDNAGIANSLTRKIQAAAGAVAEHENDDARETLNAFKHEVSAQTGKHITGIAPQVLQEDADSLISQLPKSSDE
jgi:hypothetical protein